MPRFQRPAIVILALISSLAVLGLILHFGIVFSEFRGGGSGYVQQVALCLLLAIRVFASVVFLVPLAWRALPLGNAPELLGGAILAIVALAGLASWEWRLQTLGIAAVATFLTAAGWVAGWKAAKHAGAA